MLTALFGSRPTRGQKARHGRADAGRVSTGISKCLLGIAIMTATVAIMYTKPERSPQPTAVLKCHAGACVLHATRTVIVVTAIRLIPGRSHTSKWADLPASDTEHCYRLVCSAALFSNPLVHQDSYDREPQGVSAALSGFLQDGPVAKLGRKAIPLYAGGTKDMGPKERPPQAPEMAERQMPTK